jgi:MSHA biogenesis protein MshM
MTLYLDHFGLTAPPFRITPGSDFFYAGANRGVILDALMYAIGSGDGIIKVVGEVGSGKTMLCRVLMERIPDTIQVIYLAVPSLSRDDILDAIADDLGLALSGSVTQRLKALQQRLLAIHGEGRRVVMVIDEAHAMPMATLEEIRLLSNLETGEDKLLQIVLFGQPELDTQLAAPNMRQLRDRITQQFVLAPLAATDLDQYVDFRLRRAGYKGPHLFPPEALSIIHEASEGLSRRINIFADKTLLAAYAGGTHTVTADHARAAIADIPVQPMLAQPRKPTALWRWPIAAAIATAGLGLGFWWGVSSRKAPPASEPVTSTLMPAPSPAMPASASPLVPRPASASPAPSSTLPSTAASPAKTNPENVRHSPRSADRAVERWRAEMLVATLRERIAIGNASVASESPARSYIQLATRPMDQLASMTVPSEVIKAVTPAAPLNLVRLGTGSTQRVAAVLGPYASIDEGLRALSALPKELSAYSPQVRSAAALKSELSR